MTMTKRGFLQALGAVAGAEAVYRAMQAFGLMGTGSAHAAAPVLPADAGAGRTVAILGAGISGMAAAYELSKAGFRCTILEATGRAGGRNLTARRGDVLEETDSRQTVGFDGDGHLYANMGPARIPYHHRAVLGYCKEFGVELEVFTNDNRAAFFHNTERFGGGTFTGRQVSTDTRGYIAELLAKAINRNALDAELTGEDKERFLNMLKGFGGLGPDYLYKGSGRAGYRGPVVHAGLKAGEPAAPLDFDELLASDFMGYKQHYAYFLNGNPTLFQPVGGMDALAKAFEARVGPMIRYGSTVRQIRRTSGGVRIVHMSSGTGSEAALEADFAVCTIPATVLRDIPNDFAPATQAAISAIEYVPAVKIAYQTRRRFWEEDHAIYGGISWTDQDITQIWYPPNGYHSGKGILIGAYIWGDKAGRRYSAMSPPERLRSAVAEGGRLHPELGAEVETGVSRSWLKTPFQKGAWPKSAHKSPEALWKPDGAIYFAGDQITALPGWQEGAVLAAHVVAEAITKRAAGK